MDPKVLGVIGACVLCLVSCQPVERSHVNASRLPLLHTLWRRFVDPSSFGALSNTGGGSEKMRTKRGAEECERLQLCKLHARSRHSLFAAFDLYFVNKENARLWDHAARSRADCERRFSCDR